MQTEKFIAVCPFEIGDKVILNSPEMDLTDVHTITDIATIHKVKSGITEFAYELDNDGKYVMLKV